MIKNSGTVILLVITLVAAAPAAQSATDRFQLNQIQVIGSHNSYKKAIDPELFQLLRKLDPNAYSSLEFSHISFAEQLDLGLRKLEIDIVYDPTGGLYAKPLGLRLMRDSGATDIPPFDPKSEMQKP